MNIALSLPRGLRHPSWYAPLLLPVLPMIGAYGANDASQFDYLLCAGAMLLLGLLYTLGLSAFLSRTSRLVRKEVEQLKPAWLLGLFAAQAGLLFSGGPDISPFLVIIPPLLYALLASLSLGIEFQQRTMPALLCAPIDRHRVWRIKMSVLGAALASIVLVLALCMATNKVVGQPHDWIYLGISAGLAFTAWATVPLWTLLTRNLLAGLVFAIAIPPLTLSILAAFLEWLLPHGPMQEVSEWTLGALALVYTLGSPFIASRRWSNLEAPDQSEKELSVFLSTGRSASKSLTQRSWFRSLIAKELRLQSITLLSLGVALVVAFLKPLAPQTIVSQELISLLVGLFAVMAILLAGSTAIAEERRLGTLDTQVLLPVSRTLQWFLKLALGLATSAAATLLLYSLFGDRARESEVYLHLSWVLVLFVCSFFASSATPNSLRALLYGLTFTATMIGLGYSIASFGWELLGSASQRWLSIDLNQSAPWLEKARALSETEIAALESTAHIENYLVLKTLSALACAVPFAIALRFALVNFRQPAAASRSLGRQFLLCVLAALLVGLSFIIAGQWLQYQWQTATALKLARRQITLEAQLSPAQLQLYRHSRRASLNEQPDQIVLLRRTPSAGFGRTLPVAEPSPSSTAPKPTPAPRWTTDVLPVPLTPMTRAHVILDADIPEEIREALRREAIAEGDTRVSPTPGKPPGPWPSDLDPVSRDGDATLFQMSPDLMRRYGLTPSRSGRLNPRTTTTNAATDNGPGSGSSAGTPTPRYQMSPELMRRYGLIPAAGSAPNTNASTPPTP